ncbi:DUF664 domain-containing protein [Streptomyces sp. NPDC051315]|uniref:mycothiol transferase n=1 Tax=Streptomyces sp. NPDC051315 TaxID=3365650 RepID=UPI0037B76A8C
MSPPRRHRRRRVRSGGPRRCQGVVRIHLIEKYARHNGHADILRERIYGVTEA